MADRIERNVIIARSGVYEYYPSDLKALRLIDPPERKDVYRVYRPAIVLTKHKDKFTKLPLTKEHPTINGGFVAPGNFQDLAIGWSGDTSEIVMMPDSQEIGIQSTCQLMDEQALSYYDSGFRDVSPGYLALFEWAKGETVDGEAYDIIMTDIELVNHLAFTQSGRGGQGVAMDSATLADITYYSNRLTTDSSLPDFRTMIADIVEYRGEYEDDEIKIGVMELLKLCDQMPDCEQKAILQRIIKDFYNVKNAFGSDDAAKTAADLVAGRYESLDSKIMEDSMQLFGKAKDADPIPAEKEKEPAAPAETPPAGPVATEAGPGEPPVAPAAAPAPAAPDPVAHAAMEVSQMPDDVNSLDDPNLLLCLNGIVKALKALMPGEVQEPEHQAAPVPDSDTGVEIAKDGEKDIKEGEELAKDGEDEPVDDGVPAFLGKTPGVTDSIFKMSMVSDSIKSKGLAEFSAGLYKRKGAK